MVKKKGPVWNFFNENGKGVTCKYCAKDYKQSNSVKMERHIKKCFKCPAELKRILTVSVKTPTRTDVFQLQPLTVDGTVGELEKAGPSSVDSNSSCTPRPSPRQPQFSSASSSTPSYSSLPRSLISPSTASPRGISSFLDQMDAQTNVSILFQPVNTNNLGRISLWPTIQAFNTGPGTREGGSTEIFSSVSDRYTL